MLLRHSQPPTSPLRQHHVRIPLLALPTPRFFPASLPTILHIREAVEPYLQRHHYANEVQVQVMPCCGMAGMAGHILAE